jgi:hypothetical protein
MLIIMCTHTMHTQGKRERERETETERLFSFERAVVRNLCFHRSTKRICMVSNMSCKPTAFWLNGISFPHK